MPIPTLPFPLITNFVQPDDEAVKISPVVLSLLTTKEAKEVLPETEAIDRVPEFRVPLMSKLDRGEAVP